MRGEIVAPLVWIGFVYVISKGYIESILNTVLVSLNWNPPSAQTGVIPGDSTSAGFRNIFGQPVAPNYPQGENTIPGNPNTNTNIS